MTHQPHDLISKDFLHNLEVAKCFLRAYLPKDILARCDLDSLVPIRTDYIEPDLKRHFIDVLYSINIDGNTAFIYVLIEPQHKPEKLLPLRVFRYVLSPLKEFAERYGDNTKLPLIIPLVLYSGKKSPYPYSLDLFECFEDPELARKTLLHPKLIDLSVLSDEELQTHGYAAFLELTLKHVQNRDVLNLARFFVELLKTHPLTRELFKHMVQYTLDKGESENYDEFLNILLTETSEGYREETMTIREQLENRAYHKGMYAGVELGKQEGMQKGEHEKAIAIAKNMLLKRLDAKFVQEITGLPHEDILDLIKIH